jgi:hypothetical protein
VLNALSCRKLSQISHVSGLQGAPIDAQRDSSFRTS